MDLRSKIKYRDQLEICEYLSIFINMNIDIYSQKLIITCGDIGDEDQDRDLEPTLNGPLP